MKNYMLIDNGILPENMLLCEYYVKLKIMDFIPNRERTMAH